MQRRSTLDRKKTRIELLQEMKERECITECNGQWLQAAYNLLQQNEIPVRDFVQTIYVLLEKRPRKI